MIIYTHPKGTIFLSHKQDQSAPRWDTWSSLAFSKKKFNCSFNYVGAIIYGRIEIGRVSGGRSIPKSISLSRGTRGRVFGKTSRNSSTIETDWMGCTSTLESFTRTKWYTHPLNCFSALRLDHLEIETLLLELFIN